MYKNPSLQFFLIARDTAESQWDECVEEVGRKLNGAGLATHVITYKGRTIHNVVDEHCNDHPTHIGHRQIFELIRKPFAKAMNWSSVAKPTQICNMNKKRKMPENHER